MAAPTVAESSSASANAGQYSQQRNGQTTEPVRLVVTQHAAKSATKAKSAKDSIKSESTPTRKQSASKTSPSIYVRNCGQQRPQTRDSTRRQTAARGDDTPKVFSDILEKFPAIKVPELPELSEHTFTREELAEKLGGNTTDVVVQ